LFFNCKEGGILKKNQETLIYIRVIGVNFVFDFVLLNHWTLISDELYPRFHLLANNLNLEVFHLYTSK